MEKLYQYFKAHIEWVKTNICSDPAILVDSTGLPNSIHMALSAISNHNGKISREARMTTMVQRDSGYFERVDWLCPAEYSTESWRSEYLDYDRIFEKSLCDIS